MLMILMMLLIFHVYFFNVFSDFYQCVSVTFKAYAQKQRHFIFVSIDKSRARERNHDDIEWAIIWLLVYSIKTNLNRKFHSRCLTIGDRVI